MLSALESAYGKLEDLLQAAKDKPVTGSDVPGDMFLPAVGVYKELFEKMSVKTTKDFEKKIYRTDDVDGMK